MPRVRGSTSSTATAAPSDRRCTRAAGTIAADVGGPTEDVAAPVASGGRRSTSAIETQPNARLERRVAQSAEAGTVRRADACRRRQLVTPPITSRSPQPKAPSKTAAGSPLADREHDAEASRSRAADDRRARRRARSRAARGAAPSRSGPSAVDERARSSAPGEVEALVREQVEARRSRARRARRGARPLPVEPKRRAGPRRAARRPESGSAAADAYGACVRSKASTRAAPLADDPLAPQIAGRRGEHEPQPLGTPYWPIERASVRSRRRMTETVLEMPRGGRPRRVDAARATRRATRSASDRRTHSQRRRAGVRRGARCPLAHRPARTLPHPPGRPALTRRRARSGTSDSSSLRPRRSSSRRFPGLRRRQCCQCRSPATRELGRSYAASHGRSDRRTKIVATLGPASDSPEKLRALVAAGMDAARLNLSHGTHEEHAERARRVREARGGGRPPDRADRRPAGAEAPHRRARRAGRAAQGRGRHRLRGGALHATASCRSRRR